MRKAWQGGPALPRAPPGRRSLTRLRLLSQTSERTGLQAQIRELTEELVKHRFDLKHASVEGAGRG